MRFLVVVLDDSAVTGGSPTLPSLWATMTVVGDGVCIEEAQLYAADFPGSLVLDTHQNRVIRCSPPNTTERPLMH